MDDSRVLEYSFVSVNLRDILPQARKITDGINQALVLNNRACFPASSMSCWRSSSIPA